MTETMMYPEITRGRLLTNRVLAVLAGCLMLAAIAALYLDWRSKTRDVSFPTSYQAVLLSNGTVYYGELTGYGTANPVLRHAFYIVSRTDQNTKAVQNILVRRGKELHGPDRMYLNPSLIEFVETVGQDSKVAQLIAEAGKP
ncbi:MAG TPA: hypothetical protein VGL72_31985 [Bryobacteraceae bacterium]|jgi:hypothetical protein